MGVVTCWASTHRLDYRRSSSCHSAFSIVYLCNTLHTSAIFLWSGTLLVRWSSRINQVLPKTFEVSVLRWTEGTRRWETTCFEMACLVATTFFSEKNPSGIIVVKWWKWSIIAGVVILTILIPMVAVERQTTTYIFTSFYKPEGLGISSSPYIFFLGLLMSQYSLAGFDASAHMVRINQYHHHPSPSFHLLIPSSTLTWSLSIYNPLTTTNSDVLFFKTQCCRRLPQDKSVGCVRRWMFPCR